MTAPAAAPQAPDTFYGAGFAEFYDRYGTGWTRDVVPVLADWLADRPGITPRRALDLACGTGVSIEILAQAGWEVVGLDLSAGMLGHAARRLTDVVATGRVSLRQADMTTFELERPVPVCVALEGALNHLPSGVALQRCFERVAAALTPGGTFLFDLYEPHHFRGWHHVSAIDEPDAVVVRRGVWDEDEAVGMLRISGFFDDGSGPIRVNQTVTSRWYPEEVVHALLTRAGLRIGDFTAPVPACACGRSRTGSCRTVYVATRPA